MGLSTLDPAPAAVEVSLAFLDELREKAKVVAWLKAHGLRSYANAISRNEHRAEAGEKPEAANADRS